MPPTETVVPLGTETVALAPGSETEALPLGTDAEALAPGSETDALPFGTDTVALAPGSDTEALPPGTDTVALPPGTLTVAVPPGPIPSRRPIRCREPDVPSRRLVRRRFAGRWTSLPVSAGLAVEPWLSPGCRPPLGHSARLCRRGDRSPDSRSPPGA